MRIVSSTTKIEYEVNFQKIGENHMPCPECSKDRKHTNKKSFSFNTVEKIGKCFNCNASFYEWKEFKPKKEYKLPEHKNNTGLTNQALKYFEGRAISQNTLNLLGVYSQNEYMPQVEKEMGCICFPFYKDDKLINIKFRDALKNFKLVKDAELIFYNINALKSFKEIIITEGEIDCLSFIESGLKNCISVPNGASAKNLEYLDNYTDLFDAVEKIYIATDNDLKGIELRNELIRRFGPEKCCVVLFKDCKDANEYLVKYGAYELSQTIKTAYEVPVEGIVNLHDFSDDIYSMFVNGVPPGMQIGFKELDQLVTWETGRLLVVTGIPSHGKSEIVDFITMRLNLLHGWKVAYFSPENYPVTYHYAKLVSKLTGKEFKQSSITIQEYDQAFDYIEDNYSFIYPEEDMTYQNILDKAKFLVKKKGIRILVLDPYNKIDHQQENGESETKYISRFLDKLTSFAKRHNVLVVLVAHPTKMQKDKDSGRYPMPTLYDINGSANFYNKCDYGISVYRDFNENSTQVNVIKVKFKNLGEGGMCKLIYNYTSGRYEQYGTAITHWDNKNYLTSGIETKEPEIVNMELQEQSIPVNYVFNNFNDQETETPF